MRRRKESKEEKNEEERKGGRGRIREGNKRNRQRCENQEESLVYY